MQDAKPVSTPLASSSSLTLNDGTAPVDSTPYRQLTGALQYLALTRPDIAYSVNRLSQFMQSPTVTHWASLKRILRYLKGTLFYGLFLHNNSLCKVTAFSNADWGENSENGTSTTAYVVYLGRNVISWKSSKQKFVSLSSTVAVYRVIANTTSELIWISNLLSELGCSVASPLLINCDNRSATYVCANTVFRYRMKHLAFDYHFVRERVQAEDIRVLYVPTTEQIADTLTKSLRRGSFLKFRSKISVADGSSILRGM